MNGMLQDWSPPADWNGSVSLEQSNDQVVIEVDAAAFTVNPADPTRLQLRWESGRKIMWIGHLQVARHFQRRGLGRSLVRVSESLARRLRAKRLLVFPLHQSRGFWVAMDYRPHPKLSRVLVKNLQLASPEGLDRCSISGHPERDNSLIKRKARELNPHHPSGGAH